MVPSRSSKHLPVVIRRGRAPPPTGRQLLSPQDTMFGGKRFHVRTELERWSVVDRSTRAGEGARYVGWAKEASDSSHGGTVSSRRR